MPAPANAQPVVGEARDNGQPAPAPVPAGPAGTKTLADIELPEYAGAIANTFFEEGITKEKIENLVKKYLEDQSVNVNDITITADTTPLSGITYGNGRQEKMVDVNVTLVAGSENKNIKVKCIYYRPPYASQNSDTDCPFNHSLHNSGKFNVADPNNYQLTSEEQAQAKKDFLAKNKGLKLAEDQLSIDDQGKLTITIKDTKNNEYKADVLSYEFISYIGNFPQQIIIFGDKQTNEPQEITNPVKARLRDNVNYTFVGGSNSINSGATKDKLYGNDGMPLQIVEENGHKYLTISGTFDKKPGASKEHWGVRRVISVRVDNKDTYSQSYSNYIWIRKVQPKNTFTIRNVDIEKQHVDAAYLSNAANLFNWDMLAYQQDKLPTKTNGNEMKEIWDKEKVASFISDGITVNMDTSSLQHVAGTQEFTADATSKTTEHKTNVKHTLIYYTEKISDTLVKDKDNLSDDEKNIIIAKVKKANKLVDTDQVTVDKQGNVTVIFKRDIDGNGTVEDNEKWTKKFTNPAPLVTVKYDDQTTIPGDKKESTVVAKKAGNDFTFPTGATFELPEGSPEGISVDTKGKVTYSVPKDFKFDNDKDNKVVEGKVKVTLPKGDDQDTSQTIEVQYKFTVEKPGKANIEYVTSDALNKTTAIAEKFHVDGEKYPTEISGKNGSGILKYTDTQENKDFKAPKFVGYTYSKAQVNGNKVNFTTKDSEKGTLQLVYTKLDEIVDEETYNKDKNKYAGYVKVTFKDVDGAKVAGEDNDKVYYVNPKAGVKVQADGANFNLVGKKGDGQKLKIAVPAVTADANYVVNYHKEDSGNTTTWPYDNYAKVDQEIKEAVTFTAQVKADDATTYTPAYEDGTVKIGETKTINAPSFKDKQGTAATAPQGTTYEKVGDKPDGVTVDVNTGKLKVKPGTNAKIGDVLEVKVKVKYPDKSEEEVTAKITVTGDIKTTKVFVKNPDSLTEAEKKAVKKAVEDANKDPQGNSILPTGAVITVDEKGNVTIKDKEGDGAKEIGKLAAKDTVFTVKDPELTLVDDLTKLTQKEKDAVKKAVEDANKDPQGNSTLPTDTKIEVAENGKVTIKDAKGTAITTIEPAKTVYTIKAPKKTVVGNKKKLTEDEKKAVKKAVEEANKDPQGNSTLPKDITFDVGEDGQVTFKKGNVEVKKIPGKEVVEEKASSSSTGSSQTDDRPVYVPSQDVEARIIYPAMTKRKPYVVSKTGEMANTMSALSALVILLCGAVVSKRKH